VRIARRFASRLYLYSLLAPASARLLGLLVFSFVFVQLVQLVQRAGGAGCSAGVRR
jgi:hypothetical protein